MKHLSSSGLGREARRWLQYRRNAGLSPGSLDLYARIIRRFDNHLRKTRRRAVDACEVTQHDVRSWQNGLVARGLKLATLESWLGAIYQLFGWLERSGRIFANPCRDLVVPRSNRPLRHVPSEQEVLRVLLGSKETSPLELRDRAMLEVLYGAGLRRSELIGLTLDSIDPDSRVVRVIGKGRERVVPLTRAALKSVGRYCQDGRNALLAGRRSRWLWISPRTREQITIAGIRHLMTKRGRELSFKLGAQVFRRAFATHLLNRGVSLADLQLLLGHANYQNLHHYVRYSPQQLIETHRRSRLGK